MASARMPVNPLIQNALIALTAGLVSSLLCVKVYGAPLSVSDKSVATNMPSQAAMPAPTSGNGIIEALLRPQGPIAGTAREDNGRK
ncbi:hypothetical protein BH10PSE6_BH10PSE6_41420 [soil metagenome]